jgi:hypothetical protein
MRALLKRAQDAEAESRALRQRQTKKAKEDTSKVNNLSSQDAQTSNSVSSATNDATEELREQLEKTQRALKVAQRRAQESEQARLLLAQELERSKQMEQTQTEEATTEAIQQAVGEERRRLEGNLMLERQKVRELQQEITTLRQRIAALEAGSEHTSALIRSESNTQLVEQLEYWRTLSDQLQREKVGCRSN